MPSERNNIKFPMWRKKIDASMFVEKSTYIPEWIIDDLWEIREVFPHSSRKNPQSEVDILYNNPGGKESLHDGWVTTTRYDGKRNDIMRFHVDEDVKRLLVRDFPLTHRRMLEKTSRGWNSPKAEREIPFWEFIDIEFDADEFTFILTPHYNLPESMMVRFPEMVENESPRLGDIPDSEAGTEDDHATATPRPSDHQESKKLAIEKLGLKEAASVKRTKWYIMPDGRTIFIKYSKWYDRGINENFWYGVTPKSLEIAREFGITHYGFIVGREGCVILSTETVLEYINGANTTLYEDLSVRHFHFFINRRMAPFHWNNQYRDKEFEHEFVPFD